MRRTNDILWKQTLRDVLLELDPEALREKVDVAKSAIKRRLSELESSSNPDGIELSELMDGLHTVQALGFLTRRPKTLPP